MTSFGFAWFDFVFADYSDFSNFNFEEAVPSGEARAPLDKEEAVRLITMKLRVMKIEPPGEDDGKAFPVVFFTGSSRSIQPGWEQNANFNIRGERLWGKLVVV